MGTGGRRGPRRIMGFDYGTKRIGTAVGQETTRSATPLCTLATIRGRPDWQRIRHIVEEWQPDRLVVGRPLQADGRASEFTRACERFGAQLAKRYGLPVETVDERLSSHEAELRLRAAGRGGGHSQHGVDAMAACLIVESWFLANTRNDGNPS